MKRDDPVREELRAARELAQLNLDVLCQGIGRCLAGPNRSDPEDVRNLLIKINTDLQIALETCEAAEEAYRPYWARRYGARARRVTVASSKKQAEGRQRLAHSAGIDAGGKKK